MRCTRLPMIAISFMLSAMGWADTPERPASLGEFLSAHGHPNTAACTLTSTDYGIHQLLVFQFADKGDNDADQAEAVALLRLLAPGVAEAGFRFVGFEPTRNWDKCRTRSPEFLFWRDYDDNWRLMRDAPIDYLARLAAELPEAQRGTPAEAHVLFSLGHVEQRLGRIEASVAHFEEAYEVLSDAGDPKGISANVLVPLIHHYFGDGRDEARALQFLKAYALVVDAKEGDKYLPLIKVAPVYPRSAQRAGREGYVLLEFTVDVEGRVRDPVVVEENPPEEFRAAAIAATKEFRYVPRVVNGEFVPVSGVRNLVVFRLQ